MPSVRRNPQARGYIHPLSSEITSAAAHAAHAERRRWLQQVGQGLAIGATALSGLAAAPALAQG
ncbi:MAG: hypothetical protein RLZZ524_521, partial [Pseudomonadota bacterium]